MTHDQQSILVGTIVIGVALFWAAYAVRRVMDRS